MLKWLGRIGLGLLVLVVLVVAGGAGWEAFSRSAARKNHPAPGRLVDIGGRRIQIDCRGTGSPTVVFENGLDSIGSVVWSKVHDQVARTTRACAYSRAGLMWSDPSGRPFSAAGAADDLAATLAKAGEKGPFVMVGHSMGGPYLTTFVARRGDEVAGLVFVDTSHPEQVARLRAAIGRDLDQDSGQAHLGDKLAWTGVVRLIASDGVAPDNIPPAAGAAASDLFPSSLHAMVAELDALDATLAAADRVRRSGPHPFGDRPLVVLSHATVAPPAVLKAMKVTPAQSARMEAEWLAMQKEQATWSTRGSQHVVPASTHYIQLDQPEAVVAAIEEVVAQVRADGAEGAGAGASTKPLEVLHPSPSGKPR